MKQIILFYFTAILSLCYADCQPVVTDASNKRIMQWDSSYTVESKWFRANNEYQSIYQYIVKRENKLIAEFYRHDDSSYLFLHYDSLGKRLQRGLIKFYNGIFDSIIVQIPNFLLDVDGSKGIVKDTMLYDYSYRKNGIWWEKDSTGNVWKGKYKNGLREGEWKQGFVLCCNEMPESINDALHDSFRPYITYYFKDGNEINRSGDSLFWPKIKGKWFLDISLSNTTVILHRSGRRMIYNFKSATQVGYPERTNDCSDCFKEFVTTWKQKGNLIMIGKNEKTFEILKCTNNDLIVRATKHKE